MIPAPKTLRVAKIFTIAGLPLLPFSGLGLRLGLWGVTAGLLLFLVAAVLCLIGVVFALIAAVTSRPRHYPSPPPDKPGFIQPQQLGFGPSIITLGLGLIGVGVFLRWFLIATSTPPIHDVTTDTDDPPKFVAILPLRATAPNGSEYGGAKVAEAQHKGYPDLTGMELHSPPERAWGPALTAAKAMGWDMVAADSAAGRIEATATTRWFGFKDDVVIRLRPAGSSATRLDVRSVSRLGGGDVGTNAKRIRAYLGRVRDAAGDS